MGSISLSFVNARISSVREDPAASFLISLASINTYCPSSNS